MGHDNRVLIAGAGIGGLTAALALLRAGRDVAVLEQSTTLGEVGAGLTITPNASRALASLGLADALTRFGSAPQAGAIKHYATGDTLVQLPQDHSRQQYGAPLYHVHRADLHAALARAVETLSPGCVRLGACLAGLEQSDGGVAALLGSGARETGIALIGCDGARSRVREACHGDGDPQFTGYVAWRGLVPGDALSDELRQPPLAMWLGPRRLFIRYRLRGGTLYNYVALARRAQWAEEGWSVPSTRREAVAEFHDFEPAVRAVIEATPPDSLYRWGIFARQPLDRWGEGRVTLLGDAAHAMPPFLGQGAVMAIEDGVVLGRVFAMSVEPVEALRRYERARLDRTATVMRASWDMAPLYFGDEPRGQMAALAASMAAQRESYAYDAAAIPL